ncbi:MAG TPA: LamG-like jellyroll fold domain-containing protein, partial [Pirellulales bacterium]|nr:LamG-like jellyroll fold domain-containing protein [Pirellulales bacterium]
RIERAYQLALGRSPTSDETLSAERFMREQARRIEPEEAASAQAQFLFGKIPFRDGQAALCDPDGPQHSFQVPDSTEMPSGSFTIEAFVLPRSIYDSGAVRAVAAKWNGKSSSAGWQFGITGRGSRRKPQTLVMQMFGTKLDGTFGEEAIFSDQHIEIDKPYYLAAAVRFGKTKPGKVTFYVKDLSNDDEPLLTATVPHNLVEGVKNDEPLGLGGLGSGTRGFFDGLLDSVRLSSGALGVDDLLFTDESLESSTVGYWQFEMKPDVFADSSGHGLNIQPRGAGKARHVNVEQAAWIDFCHVLLNSSEFLYVE